MNTNEADSAITPVETSNNEKNLNMNGYGNPAAETNGKLNIGSVYDSQTPPPDYEVAVAEGAEKPHPSVATDKDGEKKGDDSEEKEKPKMVGAFEIFRFASGLDKFLLFLGTLLACANGCALPCMIIVFGDMIDSFIGDGSMSAALEQIPWEQFGTTQEEAIQDQDLMRSIMAKLNMTEEYDAFQKQMTDSLLEQMEQFAIYYICLGCAVAVCAYGQVSCFLVSSLHQTQRIRHTLFRSILKQEIGWYDTNEIGELNTRLTDDVNKIQEGIGDKIGTFFQWMCAFIAGIVIGFVYGWLLTLVILAVAPLLAICGGVMSKLIGSKTSQELTAYAQAGAVAEEVLGSIRTVFAFGGQKKEIQRYCSHLDEAKRFGIRKGAVSGGMGLVFLFMFCSYALAFWFGARLVREEQYAHYGYTPGKMLIVFFSVLIGAFSLGNAFPVMGNFAEGRGAAYKLWQIIDRKSEIDSSSDEGEKPESIEGNVAFSNVKFTYPSRPDVPVLTGLTLSVRRGQTAALVGPSGCGKSTTVQLLQRFYDVADGAVTIDDHNVRDLSVQWLRQHIGVVSQEPVLFGVSIAENIRYGRDGVTQAEIEQAALEANAHSFITSFPKGYETLVGDRGAQMSGGQKQRIAIARALVRDPRILLLDEATSALDAESEATVQEALDKARQGRTTLIVAHRLSTIKNADVIFGFQGGVVSEQGSHNELMGKGGIYATLVHNQQSKKSDDDISDEEDELVDIPLDEATSHQAGGKLERQTSAMVSLKRKRGISMSESTHAGDGKADEKNKVEDVSFGRVLAMNRPEWFFILLGCLAACANGAVQPAFAIVFSDILGAFAGTPEEQEEQINFYCIMFLLIGIGSAIAMFTQSLMFAISGENLTKRIRERSFSALMRQEMAYFDDHDNNLGALTTRLATEASAVNGASGPRLGMLFQSLASIGVGVIIGFVYSWKLTLVIMAFIPFIGIAGALQMMVVKGVAGKNSSALEDAGKIAIEAIENIRTVAALTKEAQFAAEYKRLTDVPYKAAVKKAHISGISFSFSQALIYFAYAASFYFGAWLIVNDGLAFQDMFKVFSAIVFGAMAMGQASGFAPDYGKGKAAAAKVFHLLDRTPQIDNMSTDGITPPSFEGSVEFKEVTFTYASRSTVPVLRGLSFSVESGQTVALVGSSGCGKSTSVQLLERFYDGTSGQVLFDGSPLSSLNLQWARQQAGLVQQEPVLFDASIRDNIAYGDNARDVPMDEVIAAARDANIHDFITSLPQGYDTNVGEKGAQLSGGQKQRVAIARALVRNPKLLLLDEATSALDTESEKVVQEALDRAQQGRTSVVIAHRLSTIQNADKIVVIHHGRVSEQGTHQELLSHKGLYYKLVQKGKRKD